MPCAILTSKLEHVDILFNRDCIILVIVCVKMKMHSVCCYIYFVLCAEGQKMERDTTRGATKSVNQLFLSPMLELTQSLQSLSTIR